MATFTVGALTQQIDRLLGRAFPTVSVEGELAQLQVPASGHAYLVLQDGACMLQCVIWRAEWRTHATPPRVGERVVVHGRLGTYAQHGRYQLYATRVEAVGAGERAARLAKIRDRLRGDGLLDPRRKRRLPAFPRVIGLATSLAGAAVHDFLRVSRGRWPAARILVSPCTVQGPESAPSVVRALELLFEDGRSDVVVVMRGGGSKVDLGAFDDEQLARWIATAPMPIVSAVGHEIDTPLSDEVADAAAPTPTAAAVRVLPDGPALAMRIDEGELALREAMARRIRAGRGQVDALRRRLRHPARALTDARGRHDRLMSALIRGIAQRVARDRARLAAIEGRLAAYSPYGVLRRGYAIVRAGDAVVRDPAQVAAGDALTIRVAGGSLGAVVSGTGSP
jgi:exodeoxyribonuclease VII large subunit